MAAIRGLEQSEWFLAAIANGFLRIGVFRPRARGDRLRARARPTRLGLPHLCPRRILFFERAGEGGELLSRSPPRRDQAAGLFGFTAPGCFFFEPAPGLFPGCRRGLLRPAGTLSSAGGAAGLAALEVTAREPRSYARFRCTEPAPFFPAPGSRLRPDGLRSLL